MPRTSRTVLAVFLMSFVDVSCSHGVTIEVGHHSLFANTANQEIPIFVSGNELVSGLNLFAQIGDGGPELGSFGFMPGSDGPAITAVDLKFGTIFADVAGPQDDQAGVPQVAISSIEFSNPGGATLANGLLANLTVDTSGFFGGSWDLRLDGVLPMFENGPFATDFAGVPANITNGTIQVDGAVAGDFDFNGEVNVADIDLLQNAIRDGAVDLLYDVDGSGVVTADDLEHHVTIILGVGFGDSNLDRTVDSTDLNNLGLHWRFSDDHLSWADGDFNGDRIVDAQDLNFIGINWLQTTAPAAPVPETETSSFIWWSLVLACGLGRRGRAKRPR